MSAPDTRIQNDDDAAHVKLWLEYLGKLKDREDRSRQVSGITTWVLIGLLGTLIFKGIPALPSILVNTSALTQAGVFYIFQMSFALFLSELNTVLHYPLRSKYSTVSSAPARLHTGARAIRMVFALHAVLLLSLGLYLVRSGTELSELDKIALLILSSIHALSHVLQLGKRVYVGWRENRFSLKLSGFAVLPPWVRVATSVIATAFVAYSLFSCVAYAWTLEKAGTTWLLPLSSASYVSVLIITLFVLVMRWVRSGAFPVYTDLEQQILLEGLSSQEIKKRFMDRLFGLTLQEWFAEVGRRLERGQRQGDKLLTELETALAPIAAMPPSADSLEAAKKVFGRTEAAQLSYHHELEAENILLDHARSLALSPEQAAAIRETTDEWNQKVKGNQALVGEIQAIYEAFVVNTPGMTTPEKADTNPASGAAASSS